MYNIEVSRDVEKYLKSIPKKMKERIKGQLLLLEDSPRERGSPMKGEFKGLYRMKISYNGVNYRAIYEIDDSIISVLVLLVDKREQIYERAKNKLFAWR